LGEISLHSEALHAALLQQTYTSTALCRPSDLAAIYHHVGANRVREAVVATGGDGGGLPERNPAGVNAPGYNCAFTNFVLKRHHKAR